MQQFHWTAKGMSFTVKDIHRSVLIWNALYFQVVPRFDKSNRCWENLTAFGGRKLSGAEQWINTAGLLTHFEVRLWWIGLNFRKTLTTWNYRSAKGFMHMRIQRDPETGQFILGQFSRPFPTIPDMIRHFCLNRLPVRGAEHMCLLEPVIAQIL